MKTNGYHDLVVTLTRISSSLFSRCIRTPWLAGAFGALVSAFLLSCVVTAVLTERDSLLRDAKLDVQNAALVLSHSVAAIITAEVRAMDGISASRQFPTAASSTVEMSLSPADDSVSDGTINVAKYTIDSYGRTKALTPVTGSITQNLSDADFFLFHKNSAFTRTYVSLNRFETPSCYIGCVVISRRTESGPGQFKGVSMTTIGSDDFRFAIGNLPTTLPMSVALVTSRDTTICLKSLNPVTMQDNSHTGRHDVRARRPGNAPCVAGEDSILTSRVEYVPGSSLHLVVSARQIDVLRAWYRSLRLLTSLVCALVALLIGAPWIIALALNRRTLSHEELLRLATTDPLTGLANRRMFDEKLLEEWQRARRDDSPLSILFVDVDRFKTFNDRYGHVRGDHVLDAVATCIANTIRRPGDVTARFGGEEFVIALPNTHSVAARELAELVCRAVSNIQIIHDGIENEPVTVSVGCATAYPHLGEDVHHLLDEADKALYQAKLNGRNQTSVFTARATEIQ